jgi:two-component system, LuxR family, sensor kinase FixL
MNWVIVVFSMSVASSLTLALIHAFIWWRRRDAMSNALFSLIAIGTAFFLACNLALMGTQSPAQMASVIRWGQVAAWTIVLPVAWFVRVYWSAGRSWLIWTTVGLRTVSLFLNFSTGQNLNYREITGLGHVRLLGEWVPVPIGVPNPWMLVGQVSLLVLMVFVVDAAITVWRRGERRSAVLLGGSIVLFAGGGVAQTAAIFWGLVQWPVMPSLFFVGLLAVMAYELAGDALRAEQLARDLRVRDEELALATEAASIGVWSRDFARHEFWATDHWRTQHGFANADPLDLDVFLQRLHPDDRELTRQTFIARDRTPGRQQIQYRVPLPGGQIRWIASQCRVEFNRDGKAIRMRGVSLDITQVKQLSLDLEARHVEISHLLRAASLGEFSAGLAHELKQPLTAILSNAQAAQRFLARDNYDLGQIRDILRDIVAADRRANDVINALRLFLNKTEFAPAALDANTLVADVLKMMISDLTARGVRFVTEFSDLPSIRGDRVQLQQVLINLIVNAGDAMVERPQNLRVLTLRTSRAEDYVQISVADTGCGIPPGREEKIFEPYHSTKPQGLGVGLSLSRSIVLAHGGRLWAQNQSTGGAVFHVTIPACKGERSLGGPLTPPSIGSSAAITSN